MEIKILINSLEKMDETTIINPVYSLKNDSELELEEFETDKATNWISYFIKHLIFLTIGLILIIIPIVCVVNFGPISYLDAIFHKDDSYEKSSYASAIRNLTWLALSLLIITLISLIVGTLPRIILFITKRIALQKSELVKHYLEVLI